MNWLRYLAEANLYLCIFYLFYCLLLNRETHYLLNRAYLLFSCIVSFILPVLQLGFLKPATEVVTIVPVNTIAIKAQAAGAATDPAQFSWQEGLLYVYATGVIVLILLLAIKLFRLWMLTRKKADDHYCYKLIHLDGTATAFSFFSWLFIGTEAHNSETIIRHELVHIRQKHSLDIILIELVKAFNWFNPLVYFLQNSLKAVHEYIADEQTAAGESSAISYSEFLVNNAYGTSGPAISHSFFNYNLLKHRIIMLNQKRSGNWARLKYLLTVPILVALLCLSTLGFSKTYGFIDLAPGKTLVKTTTDTSKKAREEYINSNVTSKGYKYKETGYLVDNKANFRVIIIDKDGTQKGYFKNSCSKETLAMLKEKYGYTFPSMEIFNRLPPPPPEPPHKNDVKIKINAKAPKNGLNPPVPDKPGDAPPPPKPPTQLKDTLKKKGAVLAKPVKDAKSTSVLKTDTKEIKPVYRIVLTKPVDSLKTVKILPKQIKRVIIKQRDTTKNHIDDKVNPKINLEDNGSGDGK